jgi:hypothetical protein
MAPGAFTVITAGAVVMQLAPSQRRTVKGKTPGTVGVPVIVPSEFRVIPAGRGPLMTVAEVIEPPRFWGVKVRGTFTVVTTLR